MPRRWAEWTLAPVMMSTPPASARRRWSSSSTGALQAKDPVSRPAALNESGTRAGHSSSASAWVIRCMWPLASARTVASSPISMKLRGVSTGSGRSASCGGDEVERPDGEFLDHGRAVAGNQLPGRAGRGVVRQGLLGFDQGHAALPGQGGGKGQAGDTAADNHDIVSC